MAWNFVPKPTESSIISSGGNAEPWGLLIAITSVTGGTVTSIVSGWTEVSKPTGSVWTNVVKPIN